MLVLMYMLATGAQTIQYFIPTLVGQLGYSGTSLPLPFFTRMKLMLDTLIQDTQDST